jgi:hypothetical protein
MTLLSNSNKLVLVLVDKNDKVEEGKCEVPSRGGILGIKKWLARLQDLWDNNQNSIPKFLNSLPQTLVNNPWPMHVIK